MRVFLHQGNPFSSLGGHIARAVVDNEFRGRRRTFLQRFFILYQSLQNQFADQAPRETTLTFNFACYHLFPEPAMLQHLGNIHLSPLRHTSFIQRIDPADQFFFGCFVKDCFHIAVLSQALTHLCEGGLNRKTPTRHFHGQFSGFFCTLIFQSIMLASLIIPPHLAPGDKVAAVSLSWGGAGDTKYHPRYLAGVRALEKTFGVKVVEMTNTLKGPAFIYNNVRARIDDLHQAFADPAIKAVISCVGGDDSIRMLNSVDFDLLRKNPKIFIGFSDSTITHFICLKAGLRSYYGPAIMTNLAGDKGPHPYLVDALRTTLFSPSPVGLVHPSTGGWTNEDLSWLKPAEDKPDPQPFPALPWTFIQGQTAASGRLLGGCTEALPVINGTSIWPAGETWDGAILFLENFGPATSPDVLLKTLRNLGAQGLLSRLNGILFGRPNNVSAERFGQYDDVLIQATKEFGRPDLPIITRMDFGHTDPAFVIPYGAMARIDPQKNAFSIEEAGCSPKSFH